MKKRNIILATLIVCGFFLIGVGNASAAEAWYDCTVDMIGPSFGSLYVILDDVNGAFTDRWFLLDASQENKFMAAVLTQMASGGLIKIYADPAAGDYPVIYALYYMAE